MTEAQKYQGALYKEKPMKTKQTKPANPSNALTTTIPNSRNSKKPRHPYVEDAPDADDSQPGQAPPPAPSPPRASATAPPPSAAANAKKNVNVFDFLVTDETPNASRVSLGGSKEQMTMVDHAPSVFEGGKALARLDTDVDDEDREYDIAYEENGFSYGAEPIKLSLYENQVSNISTDFLTPAPKKVKDKKNRNRDAGRSSPDAEQKNAASAATSDKKRKRGHVEELDVAGANSRFEEDTPMMDAPSSVLNHAGTPMLSHSGLTGGLDRLLRTERSLSPGYEDYTDDEQDQLRYQDPQSPLKRTRRGDKPTNGGDNGLGISIKGRAGRIMTMLGGSAASGSSGSGAERPSKALVRTRRSSSEGEGPSAGAMLYVRHSKKTPNVRHVVKNAASESRKSKRKISVHGNGDGHYQLARPTRRLKAIDYNPRGSDRSRSRSPGGNDNRKLIVYRHHSQLADGEYEREKADYFLSLVTKGPESERGCSINKALKRFHRDYPSLAASEERDDERRGRGRSRADRDRKSEEEKDLWRTLRLRRNDRGEVVLFI
jgi:cell growth-regulating nucleolar protein